MRQRPGRPGGRRDRGADGQALRGEALVHVREQRRLAAEQVRDRADVDDEAVGLVERRPRPPALRPQRQPLEEGAVAFGIARHRPERGAERARVGERHARPRARGQRGVVGGGDARAVRGLGDERDGPGVGALPEGAAPSTGLRTGFSLPPAIDRQPRQPDRHDPPVGNCLWHRPRVAFDRLRLSGFGNMPLPPPLVLSLSKDAR